MSNDNKPKKHALNNPKFTLSAPCPNAPTKQSKCGWDVYGNNPRIVIKTNDPALSNKENSFGIIQAGMDAPSFFAWVEELRGFAIGEPDRKAKIQNNGYEGEPLSDIWFGKNKDGCVFISVVSRKDEKPVVMFVFGPSDDRYHKWFHGDGNPYTRAEVSVAYAKSYCTILSTMMPQILVDTYIEPPPFIPKGKDGGSYNQKQSGYQNNNRQQNTDNGIVGDDLPF